METIQFWKNDSDKQSHRVLQNMIEYIFKMLKSCDITIEIKRTKKAPTNKMRGYIFGYLMKKITILINEQGNDFTEDDVYILLKERGKFFTIKTLTIGDKEVEQKVYESFSNNGDKKRTSEFIEFCLRWTATYLDYVLETPEEYKLKRGMK